MKDETITTLIASARSLGSWLNRTAYFAAKKEAESRKKTDYETIRKLKAKVLAEMESTAMSAKSHTELMARLITRAGRMSYTDAPEDAGIFIDSVNSQEIDLATAKNLVMAYSRIRTSKEESEEENVTENNVLISNEDESN